MGATGSIGKQETAAVKRTVNLLNTADNFVHRVHMNEARMAIMQASGKLQSMETSWAPIHWSPSHVKIEY